MKLKTYLLQATACLLLAAPLAIEAKSVKTPVYMFGFAASFSSGDSIVHFTDIQQLDSAWTDAKTHFLLERSQYSYQLREHLADSLGLPHRTCVVVYNTKRAKLEKEYLKMKRLYTVPGKKDNGVLHYDVRYLNAKDFAFQPAFIDENLLQEEKPMTKAEKKAAKKAAKQTAKEARQKERGQRKDGRPAPPPRERPQR